MRERFHAIRYINCQTDDAPRSPPSPFVNVACDWICRNVYTRLFDYVHVIQILCRVGRRLSNSICIELFIWKCSSLASSWFLCGPKAQFKNMMDDRRRLTSITYLSCLATTLAVVFIPIKSSIKLCILLILLLTQFAASFWYSLSYVPYGRKTVLKILKRTFGLNDSSPVEGIVS